MEVSALTGENLDRLFQNIASELVANADSFNQVGRNTFKLERATLTQEGEAGEFGGKKKSGCC